MRFVGRHLTTNRAAPCVAIALAAGLAATTALADGFRLPVKSDLAMAGWQEFEFDGKRRNSFTGGADGSIEINTDSSASLIFLPIDIDPAQTPRLSWRWRVDENLPATDLSRRGGDDRPAAIFVFFEWDPEAASLKERMLRPLVVARKGRNAPGRLLSYTWGGVHPSGSVVRSAYFGGSGMQVILQNGDAPTGEWISENVDVAADYERIFGSPAPAIRQLAISADSDDTGGRSRAAIAELMFGSTQALR